MAKHAAVIGGGFYGSRIAVHLMQYFDTVTVYEKEPELLKRASYVNQARVHGGYHYPRSLLTGLRSRVNMHDFMSEYKDAIHDSFTMYYGVATDLSKVTKSQFYEFCRRIEAPLEPASSAISAMYDSRLVEGVFKVEEYAFNADILRQQVNVQLSESNVDILLGTTVTAINNIADNEFELIYTDTHGEHTSHATAVFNCTYNDLNQVNAIASAPAIRLKHELAEVVLVEPPAEIQDVGVTMMCGPFFSVMPFPARKLHSFTHVRYTPHTEYTESPDEPIKPSLDHRAGYRSSFVKMQADAARYMPILSQCTYKDSLFELKTVLPQSEGDDSRPILFMKDYAYAGYHSVMGGKIDNIYDVLNELDEIYGA